MASRNFQTGQKSANQGARIKTAPGPRAAKNENKSSQGQSNRANSTSKQVDKSKKHTFGSDRRTSKGDEEERYKYHPSFPLNEQKSQNASFSDNKKQHSFQQKRTNNYQAERSQMKTNAGSSHYLPLNARGNSHALRSNIQSSGITICQKHDVEMQRRVVVHKSVTKVNKSSDFHSHNQRFIPAHMQHSENVIRRQTSQESHNQKASFEKTAFLQNRSRMKSELPQTDRRVNYQAQKYDSQDLSRDSNPQPPFSNKQRPRFHAEDSKHSQFIKTWSVTNVNKRNKNSQQTALNKFQPRNRFPNRHPVAVQTTQSMDSSQNIGRNKPFATSGNSTKRTLNKNTAFNKFLHRKHFPHKYPDPVQYNRNMNSSQNTGSSKPIIATEMCFLKNISFPKQTSLRKIEHKTHFPYIDSNILHCSGNMDSSKNIRNNPWEYSETGNKQNMNRSKKNIGRKKRANHTQQQPCLLNFNTSANIRNKTESSSSISWKTEEDDDDDNVSIISTTSYTEDDNSISDTEMTHSGSGFAVMHADSSSNVDELSGILSEEHHHLDKYSLAEIEFKHKTTTFTSKKEESHISVYWDIENCAVPKTKSAVDLVKKIRDTFYDNHIEDDFIVACDTRLLSTIIERELTETLVTVIHSNSESKNAADKKLQMFLDRFAHKYERTNSAIVLVSGDSDFAPKLNEMRYRYRICINLIYNSNTRKALKAASDRSILFEDFVKELPDRDEDEIQQPYLIVSNLPKHFLPKEIKKTLDNLILSINGRVCNISSNTAEITFPDKCAADKALKKLQGTSISGNTINVVYKVREYAEYSKSSDKQVSHSESSTNVNTKEKKNKNVAKKIKPLGENVKPVNDGNTAELLHSSGALTQLQGRSSSLQIYVNTRLEDKEYWQLYFSQLWLSKGISAEVIKSENNGMYFINFESVSKAKKAKKILQKQQEIDPSGPKLLQIIKGDNILDNMKNVIKQDQQEIEIKKVEKFLNIVKKRKNRSLKYYEEKMSEAQALVSSVGAKDELNMEQKQAVQNELDELKEQKAVFSDFTNKLCQKFMKLKQSHTDNSDAISEDLIKDYGRECSSFMSGLSVYGKKNIIIKAIRQNQVVILCGETGSGKSTQVPQYLWREGFATDGLIICTQPREIAAISIAKHVSSQLGCSVGNTVGYQIDLNAKRSKSTQIMYVTDFALLKLCVTNPDFKDISCIIIDEAHERSVYIDLLLGIIKKCLPKRPNLKVIITSATINVSVFLKYFQLGEDALLQISGRTFPIEDIWYDHDVKLESNYLEKTVNIAYDIFKQEQPGDILAFLVTPAETEKAVESFQAIFKSDKCKSKVITHCLHGKLDVQEQQKVFEKTPDDTRKVVFSTNYAETSVTIPGIKYVVDCGMVKETRFDESKNINLFSIDFVNRSSAEQRRGRAGRTRCGKCFRLYSKVNYNEDMAEDMTPEILRVNLAQTILKLMELGIPNPMQFDFVQLPSLESLQNAMKQLVHFGAVNKINTTLTEIGKSMAKLPIEPRLSHLVLKGIEEEVGYEAVIIAALATISRIVCFLHEGSKKEGDAKKKMRFCREESDFFTYFEMYREWNEVPRAKKLQWCGLNSINGRSMRMVHDLVHELILTLSNELNINLKTKYSADERSGEKIHEIIFKSFSENLCIFSGHRKIGYLSPSVAGELHIHPSSSLCYLGVYNPQFIVYDIALETSQTFLINITPVSEEIIQKAIALGALKVNLDAFKRLTLNPYRISSVGEGVIKRGLIGEDGGKLQTLEQKIKENTNNSLSAIDINIDKGEVTVFLSACYQEHVEKIIRPIIMESQNYFYQEEQEIFGISDIAMFGAVMGVGAEIKEVLLPEEYRDVEVKITGSISLDTVIDELDKCGNICFINEGHDGCIKVTFSEVSSAIYAVNVFQNAEEFTIRSMPKFFLHDDVTPFFKVAINWIRRPCIGLAFISFESPVDLAQGFSVLSSSCIDYEGNILKVSMSKTSEEDLCIGNLPKTADSQKLEKVLKQFLNNVKLKKIALARIKPFESSAKEIESLKEELTQLLLNYTSSYQLYVDFKIPDSKQVMYNAIAYFDNSYDGQIAVNALQGRACIEEHYLKLKPTLQTCLYCNLKAFTAVKNQIDDVLILLNENSRENDYLNIRAKVQNEDTVIVTISSNNLTDMISAHEVFGEILKGEQIKCSGNLVLEKLFLESSSLFLKDLEEAIPEAYIHFNKSSKIVSVFGTPESCTSIFYKINKFSEDLSKENSKVIYLASEEYSKGLLKHLVKKYGYDLEELRALTNLNTIEINTMSSLLTVIGSERYIDENIIDCMNKELGTSAEIIADEDCPVCLGPLDQKYYRLEYCGHAYCKECIIVQLKNPNFPIFCCKKDCNEPFVVADIKWAAKEEKSVFINLCTSSLYDFIANNELIENCPTPECSMVYRVTEDENRFDCPSCQNSICTRCCVFYHYGMNCEIYQCSKSDDYSLEEWFEGDPENRKFCPSCSSPVEKNGGCNRMACWNCKSHFCWLCEKEFPTGMELHDHEPFCQITSNDELFLE